MKLLPALPGTSTTQTPAESKTPTAPKTVGHTPMAPRTGDLPGSKASVWTPAGGPQPSAVLGAQLPRTAVKAAAACLLGAAFLLTPKLSNAAPTCPAGQAPTHSGCVAEGLEDVAILPIERLVSRIGDTIMQIAEHTKGKRNSTKDKHTKPRSGRSGTKNRGKGKWVQNPNKRK